MSAFNFEELKRHIGHDIECVVYGGNANVAIECVTCSEVLLSYDRDEEEDEEDLDLPNMDEYLNFLSMCENELTDEPAEECCCPECCQECECNEEIQTTFRDAALAIFKTNWIHRHWKGNYYYVEGLAKDANTEEYIVVYHALYGDQERYTRPFSDFIALIPEGREKENVANQEFRFEPVAFEED